MHKLRVPLFIEFSGKDVLVIGGGNEGTKRAKIFLKAGSAVTVLSLDFHKELKELKATADIQLVKADAKNLNLLEKFIKKADLVVVALARTTLNEDIVQIAKRYKTLVNLTNDAKRTEVVKALETAVEDVKIALTTEGKSSLVAREMLDLIADYLRHEKWIFNLLYVESKVKEILKEKVPSFQARVKAYRAIHNSRHVRELVKANKLNSAFKEAVKIAEKALGVKIE